MVSYSASFLKSTGQIVGNAGALRATVTHVSGRDLSATAGRYVLFLDTDGREHGALACNLTLVSRIALDAALAT